MTDVGRTLALSGFGEACSPASRRVWAELTARVKNDLRGVVRNATCNVSLIGRFLLAALAGSLLPGAAWACPACVVGDPKTAGTYLTMTLIMSALPMLLVCGIGYWLWRRHS